MSLADFQRALADMVASPAMCLAVRSSGVDALADYELTEREVHRLEAVVWQRGMSANCTVHRATRATSIYTLLGLTCNLLGPALKQELDEYWAAFPRMEVRFDLEISRFAAFLTKRLKAGVVQCRYDATAIADVLAIELAREIERLSPRTESGSPSCQTERRGARVIPLSYDPELLMNEAACSAPDFSKLRRGEFALLMAATAGEGIS